MRSFFLRCILIFLLAFSGMTGIIIVDCISGTMVGYEPVLGITINQIEEDCIVATAFGQKMELNFGMFINK